MKNQKDQREVYIGEIKDYKKAAALINGNLITTHHALLATDAENRSAKEIDATQKFAEWCKRNNVQCRKKVDGEWIQFSVSDIVAEYVKELLAECEQYKKGELVEVSNTCKLLSKEYWNCCRKIVPETEGRLWY